MSSEPLLLAIDAGTGSCRAVLFDTGGRQVAMGQREYSHPEAPGVPGSQVFDTTRNWELICACVREALDASGGAGDRVAAVSTTSMREGMVLYDADGHEIWACPNVDSRAGEEAAELVRSGAAQEIYDRAGDWVAITSPARFLWIARHQPDVFGSIAHVGMLGDWIVTRLSGEFVTDPSLGSSSGLFELADRDWSDRVLELIGLERDVFPPVVEPGTVVGGVTAQAADETGLRAGTPVVAGGADTQLGLLGIGLAEPGRFTIVGGSFWQSTVLLDEPLIDPQARLRTLCHTVPGQWMMEGIGFYCGIVMRWFRDAFCELEQAEAEQSGEDVYAILERKAAAVPPGAERDLRPLLEPDAGEPLGARRAGVHRVRRREPRAVRPRGLLQGDRGGCGIRLRGPSGDRSGDRRHRGRRGRPHRRRGEGDVVAADRRRRARDPRPDPGREGVDCTRCRDLRRRRSGALRRRRPGGA